MKLKAEKIPSSQLFFLVFCFSIGSNVFLSPGTAAGKDLWLAIAAGFAEGLVFILIQLALMMCYPQKTLVEFNDIIFGRFLGKVISFLYLLYFLQAGSYVLRSYTDFFSSVVYPRVPVIIIAISLIVICIFAVRSGIEVLGRCSLIIGIFFIIATIFTTSFLIKTWNFKNLLPVMDIPIKKFITASHAISTLPFGEFVVFMMIVPFANEASIVRKTSIKAFLLAFIGLSHIPLSYFAVLGETATISTYPTYLGIRQINIGDIITRVEIILAISGISIIFIKASVYLYGFVIGTAQLFKMRCYKHLTIISGVLILSLSLYVFDNFIGYFNYIDKVWPYYSIIFQVLLPTISLIISRAKKLPLKDLKDKEATS